MDKSKCDVVRSTLTSIAADRNKNLLPSSICHTSYWSFCSLRSKISNRSLCSLNLPPCRWTAPSDNFCCVLRQFVEPLGKGRCASLPKNSKSATTDLLFFYPWRNPQKQVLAIARGLHRPLQKFHCVQFFTPRLLQVAS